MLNGHQPYCSTIYSLLPFLYICSHGELDQLTRKTDYFFWLGSCGAAQILLLAQKGSGNSFPEHREMQGQKSIPRSVSGDCTTIGLLQLQERKKKKKKGDHSYITATGKDKCETNETCMQVCDSREMCLHREVTLSFCFSDITATKRYLHHVSYLIMFHRSIQENLISVCILTISVCTHAKRYRKYS